MTGAPRKAERKTRLGAAALVAGLHVLAIMGIISAFTPDITQAVVDRAVSALSVITPNPVPPVPEPDSEAEEGAAAPEGPKANPREVAAPEQTLPLHPQPAPPVAGRGEDTASGARDMGEGTGAGGEGIGTGSGQGGSGQGSGSAVRGVEKIAGDINSAKDYPRKTRDLRIGHSVTILLSVGADGRVNDCRITAPSPDPQADAITCEMAKKRFRFRPATDSKGNPVPGKYAWRQRWFT